MCVRHVVRLVTHVCATLDQSHDQTCVPHLVSLVCPPRYHVCVLVQRHELSHRTYTQARAAAQLMRTRSKGRGRVYVSPRCVAHLGPRAFWLGGVCKGGQLSEGRRAQGQ